MLLLEKHLWLLFGLKMFLVSLVSKDYFPHPEYIPFKTCLVLIFRSPNPKIVTGNSPVSQKVAVKYLVSRYKRRVRNLDLREELETHLVAELLEIFFILHWPVQEPSTVKSSCLVDI